MYESNSHLDTIMYDTQLLFVTLPHTNYLQNHPLKWYIISKNLTLLLRQITQQFVTLQTPGQVSPQTRDLVRTQSTER